MKKKNKQEIVNEIFMKVSLIEKDKEIAKLLTELLVNFQEKGHEQCGDIVFKMYCLTKAQSA